MQECYLVLRPRTPVARLIHTVRWQHGFRQQSQEVESANHTHHRRHLDFRDFSGDLVYISVPPQYPLVLTALHKYIVEYLLVVWWEYIVVLK